jgi:dipeptidyl aminopeptidase/acylaminoacyl peptidase
MHYVPAEEGGMMLRRGNLLLAAAGAVAFAGTAYAQDRPTLEQDAIAFGMLGTAESVDLSPDGSKVVYVGPGPGTTKLAYVADLSTGVSKPVLRTTNEADHLSFCGFSSNSRLICDYSGNYADEGTIVSYSRIVALNSDGTDVRQLGNTTGQFGGGIIDWLPEDDENVLMVRGNGIEKVDTRTLRASPIDQAPGFAMTDGHGTVRVTGIAQKVTDGTFTTGKYKFKYRTLDSHDWKSLTESYVDSEDFWPLAVDKATNSLFAEKRVDGRLTIVSIKLDDTLAEQQIAANPKVDVDELLTVGEGRRIIGYAFAEAKRDVVYLDPQYKALAGSLSKALPHLPLIDFVAANKDESKLLLFASSDQDPGHYYLFDRAKKTLSQVFAEMPSLEGRNLAEVRPVTYTASDGTQIPAYLTLPPGKDPKGLPAIVLPHGGPSARDEWGFDYLSQFLAARGYAVIQPEYRGSDGYGKAWLNENGFKGWRTSIGDVNAAAKYLVSVGIADPNRMAIVGWSYGGYAALQGAETEPTLYKAVVAIAPVTDLQLLKEDARYFSNMKEVQNQIGSGPHVVEGSPANGANHIEAPVLLAHADRDVNVDIQHSDKMAAALQHAGKQVEYYRIKGLDHQLADSSVRATLLLKMGQLLDRTIGH